LIHQIAGIGFAAVHRAFLPDSLLFGHVLAEIGRQFVPRVSVRRVSGQPNSMDQGSPLES
jgi:hypothetical protein